ncbi:hypothetical protein [Pseudomonas fluorescens]|uniref:hypothetical protein n=1 Tax=Pseudomonas fluorescens TaxID=294 RepID=UPI00058A78D8|nr:hypothetical protein [Pseudomonas fluorescens]CEL29306.1 hypothetical protein SRM1_02657 [Pseudomonas fluorescens]
MASPFVPFPIFCPYAEWRPSGLSPFPKNADVIANLEAVTATSLPFFSVWYCQRYLAWLAHSWNPEQASEAYYFETTHLERLLNWSFSQGFSLLDLDSNGLLQYASFFCNPLPDWCAPKACSKFLADPLDRYQNWMINPDWRPFLSLPRDASRQLGLAQAVLNKFYDFYYHEISSSRPVPTLKGKSLHSKNSPKLTDYEMDWYLRNLQDLPYGESYKISTLVYFALARSSRRTRRQLVGTSSNPGLLNQFSKNSDGKWGELLPRGEFRVLGDEFTLMFERYLKHLGLDSEMPIPPHRLFATSPDSKFARKCRVELVSMALASEDVQIREAANKFRLLTFSSMRRSSAF